MRANAAKLRPLRAVVLTIVFTAGCGVDDGEVATSQTSDAVSVSSTVGASCSTASVLGLSKQIAREVACISPVGTLAEFKAGNGVAFASSAVLPYLSKSGKDDLHRAGASGRVIVTSGYRTVAQQYLLYRWYREGRCGIAIAAPPGTSNHEGARAVDLSNWASRERAMAAHHWAHDVPGDVVHFDHLSSRDIRGRDVRAFQRLWNENHPHDVIHVNGVFDRATAARLKRAPARGFAKGPTCNVVRKLAEVVGVDGPDRVAAGEMAHYSVVVANGGDADWPAGTRVVGTDATLRDAIPAGEQGAIELDVAAPPDGATDSIELPLAIEGFDDATFSLAVTLGGDSGETSVESDDVDDAFDPTADDDGVIEGASDTFGR
jgi:hypothetical protein